MVELQAARRAGRWGPETGRGERGKDGGEDTEQNGVTLENIGRQE